MGICTRSARYTSLLLVSKSVLLSILNLFMIILMKFLNYELSTILTMYGIISVYIQPRYFYLIFQKRELSTIFTIYSIVSVYIQPRYFYLIFRSVGSNNMNLVIYIM